jgi:hypothetical protein
MIEEICQVAESELRETRAESELPVAKEQTIITQELKQKAL